MNSELADKYVKDEYPDRAGCLELFLFLIFLTTMIIGIGLNNKLEIIKKQKAQDACYVEKLSSDVYKYDMLCKDVVVLTKTDKAFKISRPSDLLNYIWVPISQLKHDRNNDLWISKWWTENNWTTNDRKHFLNYLNLEIHAKQNTRSKETY